MPCFLETPFHLLAHTGNRIEVEGELVRSRWSEAGAWQTFTISNYGGRVISSGDAVFLRAHTGTFVHVQDVAVLAKWNDRGDWQRLVIYKKDGEGPIKAGDCVFLLAHTGKIIDVEGIAVQARYFDEGKWQSLTVEKSNARRLTKAALPEEYEYKERILV